MESNWIDSIINDGVQHVINTLTTTDESDGIIEISEVLNDNIPIYSPRPFQDFGLKPQDYDLNLLGYLI